MNIQTFLSEREWVSAATDEILRGIPENFALALSGGSTPSPVYQELAKRHVEWKKANIFVVDERFVPGDHPESNQRLIRESFDVPAHFHFWKTGAGDNRKESAEEYEKLLKSTPAIDVGILGIGPDGHTASLFPGNSATSEKNRLATTSETDRFAIKKRVTLTFSAIMSIKKLVILLKGKPKKGIYDELLMGEKTPQNFPAKKLLKHKNLHIFYCSSS